jgi:large subunit ribosomal protein L21
MYAVIETGGKQYRVELGSEIEIDRLDASPGETIQLGRVLLVADGDAASIGQPIVDGARVSASVVRQDRGDKIIVFKYRPKARRRVKRGHRQELTIVRVADIEFDGRSAAKEAEAASREQEKARVAAAEEAERQAAADRALADKLAREQAEAEAAAKAEAKPAKRTGRSRKPKAEEPAPDEAAADEPAPDEPAADEPAAEEPATAEAATDESGASAGAAAQDTDKTEDGEAEAKKPKSRRSTKKDE